MVRHNTKEKILQIISPNYTPDIKDALLSRIKTTGIIEVSLTVNSKQFSIYDVGGGRSERKKWVHCFDNVSAIIFVISLTCFQYVMQEDYITNQMDDALELFRSIIEAKFSSEYPIFLVLSKFDEFLQDLLYRKDTLEKFRKYFNYEGKFHPISCAKFIAKKCYEKYPHRKIKVIITNLVNIPSIETQAIEFATFPDSTTPKIVLPSAWGFVRLLYVGHYDKKSPLSSLPIEIIRIISSEIEIWQMLHTF